jgi:ABC-type Fe3+-hydroxamate transport system substrate-binding protein
MPRFSMRRILTGVLVAGSLACHDERTAAGDARVRDDFGAAIDTAAESARRIVSLNPATTELLFALGAGELVVGRSVWDQWPVDARAVESVGPGLQPNVEAVLARRPDLVVLYASADNRAAAERLAAAGVSVLALKIDRIDQHQRATRILGALTGRRARADSLVGALTHTIDSVRTATAGLPRPRVFWHIWGQPLITIGRGSYLHELLEIAGAENIYADLATESPPVSLEDVVRRDPDVILAGPVNARILTSDPRWQAVRAVREGDIAIVDTTLVGRPSVLLGDAAVHLADLLHPKQNDRRRISELRETGKGKRETELRETGNGTAGARLTNRSAGSPEVRGVEIEPRFAGWGTHEPID